MKIWSCLLDFRPQIWVQWIILVHVYFIITALDNCINSMCVIGQMLFLWGGRKKRPLLTRLKKKNGKSVFFQIGLNKSSFFFSCPGALCFEAWIVWENLPLPGRLLRSSGENRRISLSSKILTSKNPRQPGIIS